MEKDTLENIVHNLSNSGIIEAPIYKFKTSVDRVFDLSVVIKVLNQEKFLPQLSSCFRRIKIYFLLRLTSNNFFHRYIDF